MARPKIMSSPPHSAFFWGQMLGCPAKGCKELSAYDTKTYKKYIDRLLGDMHCSRLPMSDYKDQDGDQYPSLGL